MSQVAIVTGAASGIGRATALRLARDGLRLALVDIDGAGLAETEASVRAGHGDAEAFTVDVTDAHELGELVRAVATRIGVPALLVNVAGVGVAATVPETSDADWNRVIGVNLTGPFLLARAVLPLILDRGRGVVINVASTAALVGIPARAAYSASEAGLVGLTRAIAADHADAGIRCVAICPGAERRFGGADEIAATIAFVASDEARCFNGSAVVVDGGLTAV